MRRKAPIYSNDQGLSETVSVTLMIILVIAVAAVVASIVFGLVIFYPKSAYIAVQTEAKNVSPDNWYLSVFHMNGDNAYLNLSSPAKDGLPVDFQFTTPKGATVIPLPDPADGPETWKPGDTLFVYNKSGLLEVTKNETTAREGTGLPVGIWRFDVVDRTDNVLIYSKNTGVGIERPTETSTPVNQYTITASSDSNGIITPAGVTTVNTGSNQTYSITPNTGYHIVNVLVDNSPVGNVAAYQFTNIVSSHTISAAFAINTYEITASSGIGGSISPSGAINVNYGNNQSFTISPDPGYSIADLIVDGGSVGPMASYTFPNVVSNHTITASYIRTYIIIVDWNPNGLDADVSVTPVISRINSTQKVTTTVRGGSNVLITVTAKNAKKIHSAYLDTSANQVGPASPVNPWSYSIPTVTGNHNLVITIGN